jgi:hypothetical protein
MALVTSSDKSSRVKVNVQTRIVTHKRLIMIRNVYPVAAALAQTVIPKRSEGSQLGCSAFARRIGTILGRHFCAPVWREIRASAMMEASIARARQRIRACATRSRRIPYPTHEEAGIMAIAVGQPAPEFTLKDQSQKEVKLSDFRGKNVVLIFYPLDWSPVCSNEHACFVNDMKQFEKLNAQVLG